MNPPKAKTPPPKAARPQRLYWSPQRRLPVVADVLSGARDYLDACRHYGAQSNQVYAWTGQAILTERPEALQALSRNAALMARLDSLRASGVRADDRSDDRDVIRRLLAALEGDAPGEPKRAGVSGEASDAGRLASALRRLGRS